MPAAYPTRFRLTFREWSGVQHQFVTREVWFRDIDGLYRWLQWRGQQQASCTAFRGAQQRAMSWDDICNWRAIESMWPWRAPETDFDAFIETYQPYPYLPQTRAALRDELKQDGVLAFIARYSATGQNVACIPQTAEEHFWSKE